MEHYNELSSSDEDDCSLVLGPQIGRKLKRPVKPPTVTGRNVKKPRNDFNKEFDSKTPNLNDQEETTCLVEDCRHNKKSKEENNNSTTKNGVTNEKKSETLVNTKPSTSKTNVSEPSTEFKVPNPVGPLRSQPTKQNSIKKKEQQSASTSQSKTSQNQHVFPTKNAGNSTTTNVRLSEPSTSNSTASSKSPQSNTSSSKKSTLIETTSANSMKPAEVNFSSKPPDSNKMSASSSSSKKKRRKRKKIKKKKASEYSVTSNKSNSNPDSINSNATSSKVEVIVISSDSDESESNVYKTSKVMIENPVDKPEMNNMYENLNNSISKLTIGFVKLFSQSAQEVDLLEDDDNTGTGKFGLMSQLVMRTFSNGASELELHMTIYTILFSSANSKNDHMENEDLNNDRKISEQSHDNSMKNKDFESGSKDGRKKNEDFKNSRKKDEDPRNVGKKNENFKSSRKKNEDFIKDQKKNEDSKNGQKNNENSKNKGKKKKESNKNQKIKEENKSQKIYEQQNNKLKSKQIDSNENRKYVDPNQPSTSRNYDPSCVLAVPSTSKSNNSQLNQSKSTSRVSENTMDVGTSTGSEIPVMEEETLTVDDLAVPACSNELVQAEKNEAFQEIKPAISGWIKQCIDNIPIKKTQHEKDIMHDKVLCALFTKLQLIYTKCYDILRNKQIKIIVPVNKDPNSDHFKPIIILSSSTSNEESVETKQSCCRNIQTNSVQSISSDELSLNCDIDSSSEENCATSQETLDADVRTMPKTCWNVLNSIEQNDDKTLSYMNKKEQNDNINNEVIDESIEAENRSDNDYSNSVSSNEEQKSCQNLNKQYMSNDSSSDDDCKSVKSNPGYDSDQTSLIKFFRERKSSESDCSSEEQLTYEADIDEVNSSVNEEEDDANSLTSNENIEDRSYDIYYVKHDTEDDDDSKSLLPSNNEEHNEIENDHEDSGSGEENNILVNLAYTPPGLEQRTIVVENRYIDIKLLDALKHDKNKAILLHPSQVIHGSYETVSNDSDVSMNTQSNLHTTMTEERDQSSNDDNQISNVHNHDCCKPGMIGNVIDLVTKGFSNFTKIANSNQPTENTVHPPTTEFQNAPLNYSLNSSCNETSTSSTSFNQVPVISLNSSNIQLNSRSTDPSIYCNPLRSPNISTPTEEYLVQRSSPVRYSQHSPIIQHIINPQVINNEPSIPDCLFHPVPSTSVLRPEIHSTNRNNIPSHEDSDSSTTLTQTSPHFVTSQNSTQANGLTAEVNSSSVTGSQNSETKQSQIVSNVSHVSNCVSGEASVSDHNCTSHDSENMNETNSDSNEIGNDMIQTRESLQMRRRRFLGVIEDLRAQQAVVARSTMRDSHRNLWLRQQRQSETLRRHAVQRLASLTNPPNPQVISPTTQESQEAAASSSSAPLMPNNSDQISALMPFVPRNNEEGQASTPTSNPPVQMPELVDIHRMSSQERRRTLRTTIGSINTALRRFHPTTVNQRNLPLNTVDFRLRLHHASLEENNSPQVLEPPIVIEDDDDNNGEPEATTPEALDYSISLETLNPHRILSTNTGREGRNDFFLHTMQNIITLDEDDWDLEDDEEPNDYSMPLQRLIDSTTVLFEFDETSQEERCNICLSDYIVKEILRRLPCFHTYHRNCIDEWLNRERRTCPNCRMYISSHLCFALKNK